MCALAAVPKTKAGRGFHGFVSGTLVHLDKATASSLAWGAKRRESPYDELLVKLSREPESSDKPAVLVFDDVRCRLTLFKRALKLKLKIQLSESEGKLYVRMAPEHYASTTERVLAYLGTHPKLRASAITIATALRQEGVDTDAGYVNSALSVLAKQGKIKVVGDGVFSV